jgi:predicted nuclease of predicted toxin-antitoxin system
MKFLADENCDGMIARDLRAGGHDVLYIVEESRGITDDIVLQRSVSEERILITEDHDFSELIFRDQKPAYGVILIRIRSELRQHKSSRVQDAIKDYGNTLAGHTTTITIDDVRQHSLPA